MNPLFPTRHPRSPTDQDWSIPNLNRYNRDPSLPMNYGDYHTINTDAALRQLQNQWKRNGNAMAVKPLLDLTKKIHTIGSNSNNNNNNSMKKSVNNNASINDRVTKQAHALTIKEEDELKKVDTMMMNNNNNNNKIIINKPLVQAPPKPVQPIKQIISTQSNNTQQQSIHALSPPSNNDTSIMNTQPSQSSSSSISPPPSSALFYLFFFITSFDSMIHSVEPDSSSSLSPLTILFEISIHQQQLLQMETLHEFVLSFTLSDPSSSPLDHHYYHYQPKFRMPPPNDHFFSASPFEFRLSEWEIAVGEG